MVQQALSLIGLVMKSSPALSQRFLWRCIGFPPKYYRRVFGKPVFFQTNTAPAPDRCKVGMCYVISTIPVRSAPSASQLARGLQTTSVNIRHCSARASKRLGEINSSIKR